MGKLIDSVRILILSSRKLNLILRNKLCQVFKKQIGYFSRSKRSKGTMRLIRILRSFALKYQMKQLLRKTLFLIRMILLSSTSCYKLSYMLLINLISKRMIGKEGDNLQLSYYRKTNPQFNLNYLNLNQDKENKAQTLSYFQKLKQERKFG